jgi:hypothetical protein
MLTVRSNPLAVRTSEVVEVEEHIPQIQEVEVVGVLVLLKPHSR